MSEDDFDLEDLMSEEEPAAVGAGISAASQDAEEEAVGTGISRAANPTSWSERCKRLSQEIAQSVDWPSGSETKFGRGGHPKDPVVSTGFHRRSSSRWRCGHLQCRHLSVRCLGVQASSHTEAAPCIDLNMIQSLMSEEH